ncbi:hypothetical protein SCUCBS95973_005354 [Sporothrix curviconia]|uniref:Transcription factor n=1 Tax=Sporothrix curviconia TaxID=1260050 RepID=A0ABP0BYC6_9PEZI
MMSYSYGNPYTNMLQTTSTMQQQQQQQQQQPQQPQPSQMYSVSTYQQQPNNAFLEDLSRQLVSASSTIRRRHSRSSQYGSRTPGSTMRITKPSSANNSPQSSAMMQARKRMAAAHDASMYASPHRIPQQLVPTPDYLSINRYDTSAEAVASRPARPVSWHPSSTYLMPVQLPVQQMPLSVATNFQVPAQMSAYATPALPPADYEQFPSMQPFTLSPSAYSNQTSPSTAFSPYSGNFDSTTAGHYYSPNPWALSPSVNTNGAMFDKLPSPVDCPALITGQQQQQQQTTTAGQPQIYQNQQASNQVHSQPSTGSSTASEWTNFVAHGFTAPRTPPDNNFLSAAEPAQARIPSEGSIVACQEQDDEQQEGEILVGMGLYDPPEKEVMDPTLQSYRSSVAQLLGAAYTFPEPTGKGLKLEDAWEPPENLDDDDEEDDNDEDRDAEGENQEDNI